MPIYPGVSYTILGDEIRATLQGPTTETVLIIGTAQDGPLNKAISVSDPADAAKKFGPANYSKGYLDPNTNNESGKPAGATIPLAVKQLFDEGCRSVLVCRASGSYASATLGSSGLISIRSQYPGRIYNNVSVGLAVSGSNYTLTLTRPLNKGGVLTLTGDATATTIGELVNSVNASGSDATVVIDPNYTALAPYLGVTVASMARNLSGSVTLTGGTNGCLARGDDYGPEKMTQLSTGLNSFAQGLVTTDTGTFDALRNAKVVFDVAVLDGICIDDQITNTGGETGVGSTSIAADFADFIELCKADIGPCHGIIAARLHNLRDDTDIITYANNNLLSTSFGYYNQAKRWIKVGPVLYNGRLATDSNGLVRNIFSNLSVVAGPQVVLNHPDMGGDYTYNFHVLYAAKCSVTPPERSVTLASLNSAKGFGPAYPSRIANALLQGVGANSADDLSGKGAYVILTQSRTFGGPLVVFDDPTAAYRNDMLGKYQTLHLAHSISKDIDYALSPFIGGPTGAPVMAAMEAKVQNVLDGYVASNGLVGGRGQGYEFRIQQRGTEQALGIVEVYVDIIPAIALRRISITVAVHQQA